MWTRYCLPFLNLRLLVGVTRVTRLVLHVAKVLPTFLNTWLLMGVTRVTRLVSHVAKVLLTVPELTVVSGCNKSNTSGVTRGQGTVTRVTRLV